MEQSFNLSITDILGRTIPCFRVLCGALQGVKQHPGIYPVEARSIRSPSVMTLSSDIAKYLLGDRSTSG